MNLSRRQLLAGAGAIAIPSGVASSVSAQLRKTPTPSKKPGERREPLFLSEQDARDVMRAYCMRGADTPITEQQSDFLVSRLRPQVWLAHHRDGGWVGETRLGGAPDLPLGAHWPLRPIPPDAAKKAEEWKQHHGWIARHVTQELPFEFIAQIDFAELTRDQEQQFGLPSEGRLLFFWDGAIGLLESGSQTCRVIFDGTPTDGLARLTYPAKFAEMETWWRTPDPKAIAHFKEMARTLQAAGQKAAAAAARAAARKSETPDPNATKPFIYPSRAMRLEPLWVLPTQNALELTQDAALTAFADADATSAHYTLLTSNDIGPFTADRSNMRKGQPWLTIEARRLRFMGPPHPEQDDPRFAALSPADLPPFPWNDAQRTDASRRASEWQLLLQVSMADLAQITTEGTIYFMIHMADLAKRDFSRVVAAYQQT